MFTLCCKNKITVDYTIHHSPKPLTLPNDVKTCLDWLLWYAPNTASVQSTPNELISKFIYDDFTFNLILNKFNLTAKDIHIIAPPNMIDSLFYDYYQNSICTQCQKIVIRKNKNETKSASLLKHMRNIIAHGHFTLVNDVFIGFDIAKNKDISAIIKLNSKILFTGIKQLNNPFTYETLWAYVFKNMNYTVVTENKKLDFGYDLIIEKKNYKFIIQIKNNDKGWIPLESIVKYLYSTKTNNFNKFIPVLILDEARLTKEVKEYTEVHDVIILDKKLIIEFLEGNDVLIELANKMNTNTN